MTTGPTESLSHQDAVRRLERLADRLRVVGPRLAAREGPQARDLLAKIRDGLQRLADLAAEAEGEPPRTVPELAAHALADQALVLGYDLLGEPTPRIGAIDADRSAGLDVSSGSDERSEQNRAKAMKVIAEIRDLI